MVRPLFCNREMIGESAIKTELEGRMRTALFWVITQHYPLRNNPEERSSHLLRGGSLKSSREG